ncbi:hypothetical protein PHYBOEH_008195 [Phytophthora boehmeriae]|uniref:PX domain-containing protein n=1 Tax=Phytophthora boehmeriae TaxID=109152 RepID=A0A8T1X5P7_9STRA|nr:hypothetical protein PHYBOEH_008195 [Phytophthora boehmeriae]
MEDKPVLKPRRRPRPQAPLPDSVMSFFLDSPPSSSSSENTVPKHVTGDESILEDLRRYSVRSGVTLDSLRYPSSIAFNRSRSDGDDLNSSKSSGRSHLAHRSTSSSSSRSTMPSVSKSKKRARNLANHLGGFVLHSVTPRESSILQYTSMVSPGTHTEYELVLEDAPVTGAGERWVVSRRYSGFRSLRDEFVRVFDRRKHPGAAVDGGRNAHCVHCAPILDELEKLSAKHFPKRRIWGSKSPKVVQERAEQFFSYIQGLLALATNPARRRCPLVALGFAVQLRTFLTLEREPYRGMANGGAVPFLLDEMNRMEARPDNATTLMTIDEMDGAYADTDEEGEYTLKYHVNSHTSPVGSVTDLPSPVFVLEDQEDLRSWDELESWEEASAVSSGRR